MSNGAEEFGFANVQTRPVPALRMVAAVPPVFEMSNVPLMVMPPVPAWVVIVRDDPDEFEKVKLLNVHVLLPAVVPKFFAAATRCSTVPPVMEIVPVPAMLPYTVVVTAALPSIVPFTVKSAVVVVADAIVCVPEIVRFVNAILGVVPPPMLPVPETVTVPLAETKAFVPLVVMSPPPTVVLAVIYISALSSTSMSLPIA